MRYALAVLTHDDGSEGETLAATLRSFDQHVTPPPVERLLVQDGPCPLPPARPYPWTCLTLDRQYGFCQATAMLWYMAAHGTGYDYVFWLEHDFSFKRHVDLTGLAVALDENDYVAQISLVRDSVNEEERGNGGVIGNHRARGDHFVDRGRWLEHTAYWTTTPNLTTRAFLAAHELPPGPECEGKMGAELRAQAFTFGAWGNGEPWVEHTGRRTGKGY